MKAKRALLTSLLFVVAILITMGTVFSSRALAEEERDNNNVIVKTLLQGLAKCYDDGAFSNPISVADISGVTSVLNSNGDVKNINIPNGLVGSLSADRITCKELIGGVSTIFHGSSSGILVNKTAIPERFSSDTVKEQFLKDMGYEAVPGDAQHCVHFRYDLKTSNSAPFVSNESESSVYSHRLCADVDADGKIASELSVEKDGSGDIVEFELKNSNHSVQLDCATYNPFSKGGCGHWNADIGVKWDDLVYTIFNDLAEHRNSFGSTVATGEYSSYSYEYTLSTADDVKEETTTMNYRFVNNDVNGAKKHIIKVFTNKETVDSITSDETAELYMTYLQKIYKAEQVCDLTENQKVVYEGKGYVEYRKNAEGKLCYIHGNSMGDKVNGVESGKLGYQNIDFYGIVNWLKSYTGGADVNPETAVALGPEQVEQRPETANSATTNACIAGGAAQSLGWIVCPILGVASDAAQGLYDNIVEPFLTVEPTLVNNSGTLKGWAIFQNIANIAAILLLLAVILSQVTGVGIDNYGIKKILPKFIVAMVLINLSFIVCQAAVDISNIAGKGFKDMFDNLGNITISDVTVDGDGVITVAQEAASASDGGAVATVATVGIVGTLVGVLVAFPGLTVALLPSILMALLGAVISMLVAVVLLFALLTIRKVAVIVLVVVSPLAFAAYMLPNTKKIFDKWLSLLKAMLLMFPICGLVIGGGNFVSKIILISQGENPSFFLALAAMLAGIIPFFFVPAILKGSLAMLGNVGARLSNLGRGISGKAKNAVGNSERMRDLQKRTSMARNQAIYNRLKAKENGGKELSSYQRRRMNNARLAYNNAAREDIAAAAGGAILAEGSIAHKAATLAQESATNKQELDNQIVAMAGPTKNYDADVMADQLGKLLERPTALGHDDEVMMKALMQQLTTKGGYGKKLLAKTVAGASTATRAQAAKFMSKNGDVAAAMNKNMAVAQYLRDVNANPSGTPESFDKWFTKGTRTINGASVSNSSFVLSSVITDDGDFVAQSASTVKMMVDATESDGSFSLSNDRLSAMVSNERLMDSADSDVRNAIIAAAKARGLTSSIPQRYGGAAPTASVVVPASSTTSHTPTATTGTVDVDLSAPITSTPTILDVHPSDGASGTPTQGHISPLLAPNTPEQQAAIEREASKIEKRVDLPRSQRPF